MSETTDNIGLAHQCVLGHGLGPNKDLYQPTNEHMGALALAKHLGLDQESNDEKMEKVGRRGLLTVVASSSTGRIVAHACIIASPGQVSLTL